MDQYTKTIAVKKNIAYVFKLWKEFENFPKFMKNITAVEKIDGISQWVMKRPLGKEVRWDAKTTTDILDKEIAWSSTGGDIKTSGQVLFTEIDNDTTQITVTLKYDVGGMKEIVRRLFANPEKQLEEDLRNFKEYTEGRK